MTSIIGLIGTIFFGILSTYLFLITQRKKEPVFYYKYSLLHSKKHPDVKITYKGKEIEYLSRILLIFCNKGKKEIRNEDIPDDDLPSIRIKVDSDVEILSCSLVKVTNDSIKMKLHKINNKKVEIGFSYLNYNDGGIIELLLNRGIKDIKKALDFNSTLIGASTSKIYSYLPLPIFDYFFWITLMSSFLIGGLYFIYRFYISYSNGLMDYKFIIISFFLFLLFYVFGFTNLIVQFYKRAPKSLRKYLE